MLASSTCAVQMFDVAFSRRMCCSRVCRASRSAGRPAVSVLTPTMRPGIARAADSRAVRKAACGPPNPIGTPKRCAEPIAMSAPSSPGGVARTHANGSVATTASPPTSWTRAIASVQSMTAPVDVGNENSAPNNPAPTRSSNCAASPTTRSIPIGSAHVRNTARVWGCTSACTKNDGDALFDSRRAIVIASAAAVPSSSSDALATSSPVSSVTTVWKLRIASRRPWLISGWYGV